MIFYSPFSQLFWRSLIIRYYLCALDYYNIYSTLFLFSAGTLTGPHSSQLGEIGPTCCFENEARSEPSANSWYSNSIEPFSPTSYSYCSNQASHSSRWVAWCGPISNYSQRHWSPFSIYEVDLNFYIYARSNSSFHLVKPIVAFAFLFLWQESFSVCSPSGSASCTF